VRAVNKALRSVVVQFEIDPACGFRGTAYTCCMDKEPSPNLFREVHRQVQERRDRIREKQEADNQRREAKTKEEAQREGFKRE
jgi:hypothetical protein